MTDTGEGWERVAVVVVAGLMLLGGLAGVPHLAIADTARLAEAQLPTGLDAVATVWTGSHAFLFGGFGSGSHKRDILRYDPVVDEVVTMAARLPTTLGHTEAVFDGAHAYILGGISGTVKKDTILQYDPAADAIRSLDARLPRPLGDAAAAWTGTHAFVFGGHDHTGTHTDEIVRFDPATGDVRLMDARLPTPRDRLGAVAAGDVIYLFGGSDGGGHTADVMRYDPAADALEVLPVALPHPQYHVSAVWDGRYVFLFGGAQGVGHTYLDGVLVFDPEAMRVDEMPGRLPSPRGNMGVAWTGETALLFGGRGPAPSFTYHRDVWVYDPGGINPPRDVEAVPLPAEQGGIALSWFPPVHAEVDGLLGYRVYRGASPEEQVLLAELGPDATDYVDAAPHPALTSYYTVTARSGERESAPSPMVCTAPAPAHLLPSLQAPCNPPSGWVAEVLLQAAAPVRVDLTRLDPVADVRAAPSPDDHRYYRVSGRVADLRIPEVEVYDAGLLQAEARLLLPNPAPVATEQVSVAMWVVHDPAHSLCLVRVDGVCRAVSPFDPEDPGWLLAEGAKAELVVEVRLHMRVGEDVVQWLRVPLVGQFREAAQPLP